MFDKPLNEYTLKELQDLDYQKYDGTVISDIIVVPVRKRHDSKYRCMKYILFNSLCTHICGVLGGASDIIQFDMLSTVRTLRIDCLYRSKCLRFMLIPSITLSELSATVLSEFHIVR